MNRTKPAETKLVISVWHPFTEWRPKSAMAEAIRKRWPETRVVHLPNYDHLAKELPDTDIFVGYSLRAEQLKDAKKLKWIHSTAAGVAQLMYLELRDSGIMVTNPSAVFFPCRWPSTPSVCYLHWQGIFRIRCEDRTGRDGLSRRFGTSRSI